MGLAKGVRAVVRPKWWWTVFWMRFAGLSRFGRFATRLATWFAPGYKARKYLARHHPHGYVSPSAQVHGVTVRRGANVFIGDRVAIYGGEEEAGPVVLGDRVHIHRDTIIEIGSGGGLSIGADTHIQPRCVLNAFRSPIRIGRGVQIGTGSKFFSYEHGLAPGRSIAEQPLRSKGGIEIEDGALLGAGVMVLDGVCIGKGAVVGAGAVVKHDVPDQAIAVGVPARVVRMRDA